MDGALVHVVRRILQGRQDRTGDSGGLLAKCPAVGMVETTISEGTIAAVTRRKENHYFFDYEQYKAWSRNNGVWLSPGETDRDDDNRRDPIVPPRDNVGTTSGTTSDSGENPSIENPENNVQYNSTDEQYVVPK